MIWCFIHVFCLKRSIFLLFTLQCARRFRLWTFRAFGRACVRAIGCVRILLRKSPESCALRRCFFRKFYCLLDQMRVQPLKRNQLIVFLCHIRPNACKNGQILWFEMCATRENRSGTKNGRPTIRLLSRLCCRFTCLFGGIWAALSKLMTRTYCMQCVWI